MLFRTLFKPFQVIILPLLISKLKVSFITARLCGHKNIFSKDQVLTAIGHS